MMTEAPGTTGTPGASPATDGANQPPLPDGGQPQGIQEVQQAATLATENPAEHASEPIPEYTDFTFPEGVEVNNDLLGEFKDVAKTLGLKQEQAQMLADFAPKMAQAIVTKIETAKQAEFDSWKEAARNDEHIGGEKLNENLALVKRALNAYGTPELNQIIDQTGIGNHPAFLKAMMAVGRTVSENLISGETKPESSKAWYDTLYS